MGLIVHLTETRVQFQSNLNRVSVKLEVSFSQSYRQSGLNCHTIQYEPQKKACAMPGGCYAPVVRALARLAFSCRLLVGAYGAALPGGFYREDAKGSAAKSVRDRFTALLSDSS